LLLLWIALLLLLAAALAVVPLLVPTMALPLLPQSAAPVFGYAHAPERPQQTFVVKLQAADPRVQTNPKDKKEIKTLKWPAR